MLKIFSNHLSWKLSWTPSHKWSPLCQWTWTRLNFPLQKGLPWCTASYETWLTGATLIEIGVNLSRTLDFRKPKKKHIKDNNCSGLPVEMLLLKVIISVPESLETFQPSYASRKGKWVSSFLKTMPSEIGFPMTLTSGAFVNKERNKQTSHELQNNLDSSCISFCKPSRNSQFKTSQDDTKLCKLQLSVSKFPDAA